MANFFAAGADMKLKKLKSEEVIADEGIKVEKKTRALIVVTVTITISVLLILLGVLALVFM